MAALAKLAVKLGQNWCFGQHEFQVTSPAHEPSEFRVHAVWVRRTPNPNRVNAELWQFMVPTRVNDLRFWLPRRFAVVIRPGAATLAAN